MSKKWGYLLISISTLILLWVMGSTPLFYQYSTRLESYDGYSSQCKIQVNSNLQYLFNFKRCGEAVEVDFTDYQKILSEFSATVKFTENAEGITSFYAYSPKIKTYILLKGERINLHIALRNAGMKIGSPLIFGSF